MKTPTHPREWQHVFRNARIYLGLPMQGMAKRFGVTYRTVWNWNWGKTSPSPEQKKQIAEYLLGQLFMQEVMVKEDLNDAKERVKWLTENSQSL